jgi:hypothetical protein
MFEYSSQIKAMGLIHYEHCTEYQFITVTIESFEENIGNF